MKNLLLLLGLTLICLCTTLPLHAAIKSSQNTFSEFIEANENHANQQKGKWQKRMKKMERKLQRKMERFRKKNIKNGRLGLDFIGLTVMAVGGLLIWGGLAIPFVGWLFVGIGAIVALVGLLLTFLLGGISVNID